MISGYIITFHTHYDALVCMRSFEKHQAAQNGCIAVKLIPVPRELSSACGTAVKITVNDGAGFNTNDLAHIEHDEIFTFNTDGEYAILTDIAQS